jgi:hypothetical protein
MADSIPVTSLNCRGFNATKEIYINHLLNQCDILFLQDHWLSEKQLHVIGDVNSEFIYAAVSGFGNDAVLTGRPFGGCAILLRKSLAISFKQLECESRRLLAILLEFNDVKLLLINVYFPYKTI